MVRLTEAWLNGNSIYSRFLFAPLCHFPCVFSYYVVRRGEEAEV